MKCLSTCLDAKVITKSNKLITKAEFKKELNLFLFKLKYPGTMETLYHHML